AEVPVGGRQLLPEQVAQVEEPIDPAQQHLQLEEHLLASGDLQRPDPALPLRQVGGAPALRIAHQLEEKVLRKTSPLHCQIVPQVFGSSEFAAALGKEHSLKCLEEGALVGGGELAAEVLVGAGGRGAAPP